MRRLVPLAALLCITLFAAPARAEQPRCPLPVDQCLLRFELMKTRPWLGVEVDRDSATGVMTIATVLPGGAADRAGVKPGDVLDRIDGTPPEDWFAGRAGWKTAGETQLAFLRDGRVEKRSVPVVLMPADVLARVVGLHMLEGHLAWMTPHGHDHAEPHQH